MDDHDLIDDRPSTAATPLQTLLKTLQPVRDLAQNFDIDVATHLDEYLEKLLDVLRQGDGTGSTRDGLSQDSLCEQPSGPLNFAQAAVLVENSSQVYSRKVDYFHSLVMSSLEGLQQHSQVSQNIQRRGASSRRSGGSSTEDLAFFDLLRDPEWDFLPLDDVMPLANPEDITRSHRGRNARGSTVSMDSWDRESLSKSHTTRLSLTQGSVLLEEGDSNDTRNSLRRSLPHRVPAYNTLNLVGNKCEVTLGGALLLPGVSSRTATHEGEVDSISPAQSLRRGQEARISFEGDSKGTGESGGVWQSAILDPTDAARFDTDDTPYADNDDYVADDDDGPGFSFPQSGDEVPVTSAQPLEGQQGYFMTGPTQNNKSVRFAPTVTLLDPWELLDPHAPQGTYRPLRKGRTLSLPPGVAELPSDCVTGARTKKFPKRASSMGPPKESVSKGSLAVDFFRRIRHGSESPDVPLTGLVFGDEFAYVLKRRRRVNEAERRRARKLETGPLGGNQEDVAAEIAVADYDDNDDQGFGGMDDGEDDYDGDYGNVGVAPVWEEYANHDNTGNAGLTTTVDDVFTGDENDGLTFEELCRSHIQKFTKGAETYANETNLLARVRLWQEKIRPLLEAEEERETFDIHKYGQVVLLSLQAELANNSEGIQGEVCEDSITDVDNCPRSVSFEAIARRCPKYDVPRLFLAALSLCNSGNIEIDPDLNIVMLSPDVVQPMESYLAPSAREQHTELL